MMATRGMGIDAAHFHAYPYTSAEARDKAVRLARALGAYSLGLRLHSVGFAKAQARIRERAPLPWATVLLRMAMMDCAEKIARASKSKCLITGESLSQVASQTVENLACTQSRIALPVLRPLIGSDKEAITRQAEKIGTYGISIEPHADCCALFTPAAPRSARRPGRGRAPLRIAGAGRAHRGSPGPKRNGALPAGLTPPRGSRGASPSFARSPERHPGARHRSSPAERKALRADRAPPGARHQSSPARRKLPCEGRPAPRASHRSSIKPRARLRAERIPPGAKRES
jgi:hypothetical protein